MFNIPSFKTALQGLSQPLPFFYSALDIGVYKTHEFFENEKKKEINRYLAPNLVRYYTLQVLNGLGHEAEEDNNISLENVANNGIYIKYDRYNIRILKSNPGEIPVPGISKARQDFYHQGLLNYPSNENDNNGLIEINLLLLWSVKYKPYSLGNLSLACPKAGQSTRDSVLFHWHDEIPDSIIYGSDIVKTQKEIVEILDVDIPFSKISANKTRAVE